MTTWQKAFTAQAASDLVVYDRLTSSSFPSSHRLHYLQMWLEKLCKAYTPDENFQKTHNVIGKIFPTIVKENWRRIGFVQRPNSELVEQIRQLCREIDLLHPQVDDNGDRTMSNTLGKGIRARSKFPPHGSFR